MYGPCFLKDKLREKSLQRTLSIEVLFEQLDTIDEHVPNISESHQSSINHIALTEYMRAHRECPHINIITITNSTAFVEQDFSKMLAVGISLENKDGIKGGS